MALRLLQLSCGFQDSKILFTSVELHIYDFLEEAPLTTKHLLEKTKIHQRGAFDFLDALVCLGCLEREGPLQDLEKTVYKNSPLASKYLTTSSKNSMIGLIYFFNNRLYKYWDNLKDALLTGEPQNECKGSKTFNIFDELYKDKEKVKEFLGGMQGVQIETFTSISKCKSLFENRKTLLDVGGANGILCQLIAENNENIHCTLYDLGVVVEVAQELFEKSVKERLHAVKGDFFKDEKFTDSKYDIVVMGNILHDWDLKEKKMLMKKSYEALNDNGIYIIVEMTIDDERSSMEGYFGLKASLNMLIETFGGFNFSKHDFDGWAKEIGFSKTEYVMHDFGRVLVAHK